MRGRLIAGFAALALAAAPASVAATSPAGERGLEAAGPELFMDATSGAFTGGNESGRRFLRLKKVSPGVTTIRAGDAEPEISVTTRELADHWSRLGFAVNPPTATVDSHERGKVAVRVWRPRLLGRRLAFRVEPVTEGAALPSRLGFTNLSIDAASANEAALAAIHDTSANDPGPTWLEFHTFIDAWAGDGDCHGDTWGVGHGSCFGKFTKGGTDPFNTRFGGQGEFNWRDNTNNLTVQAGRAIRSGNLEGRAPSRGSAEFYVGGSDSWFWGPATGKLQSGSDPSKTGQEGGPLRIDVQYHSAGPFANDGYTIDVSGSLLCTPNGRYVCQRGPSGE